MPGTVPRRATAAWVLYDLANTAFSFNILSAFFPVWLNEELGLPDSVYAIGSSVSMAIVLVLAPALGSLSDRARRRMPLLVASTVWAVLFTAFLGLPAWPVAIVLFGLANIGFQAGLIFYDSLLPVVSTPQNRGRVASIGVGVGYLGSFVGLAIGESVLAAREDGHALVFLATGVVFLVFALPLFLLLREPANPDARPTGPAALARSVPRTFGALWRVLRGRDVPHVGRFLVGRAFYTDAANTMILFMGVYVVAETGLADTETRLVLAAGILGAVLVAPLWGVLADRIGSRNALNVVLLCWMFGLVIVAIIPLIGLPADLFYPTAFFLGASLGGLWSTDRPLLVGLVPERRVGEFFGYYAMVGRFAAIFGPLAWALVVDGLGWGRPAAVFTLLGFIAVAFVILRGVPDPDRPGPPAYGRFLPWRTPEGTARPLPPRWPLRMPASLVYLVAASIVYVAYRDLGWIPEATRRFLAFQIPNLVDAPVKTLLNFVTAPWMNTHVVQYVYVLVLLGLFGVWWEAREGTLRAITVFYVTSIVAGLVAGAALLGIDAAFDAEWIDRALRTQWGGGSPGAFGLMGAVAARAKRPWLLLTLFSMWELNAGIWFLRSYTPAFHLTAMVTGYLMARRILPLRQAAASP